MIKIVDRYGVSHFIRKESILRISEAPVLGYGPKTASVCRSQIVLLDGFIIESSKAASEVSDLIVSLSKN